MERKHIALVGRPNVGKSRLFNRMVGRPVSIVHDQPGVTRDIVSEDLKHYTLMDTGGIGLEPAMTPQKLREATEGQVEFALKMADLILLVVDGKDGCTHLDKELAQKLRMINKTVFLVVNKMDARSAKSNLHEFFELGIDRVLEVSAEHGLGLDSLDSAIFSHFDFQEVEEETVDMLSLCFVGRPNVGKSSLTNELLDSKRLIVSDIPGTTRDAVSLRLDYTHKDGSTESFELIDTAGVRTKGKISSSVEFFSAMRTERSLEKTNVAILVLDALAGVTRQDKKMATAILEAGKPIIILVNKWDLAKETFVRGDLPQYSSLEDFEKVFKEAVAEELLQTAKAPILFTSAKTKLSVEKILELAKKAHVRASTKISTGRLNRFFEKTFEKRPASVVSGRRFKVYYALQISTHPITLKIFCNQPKRLRPAYKRYLLNEFYRTFNLYGCPITLDFVGKTKSV